MKGWRLKAGIHGWELEYQGDKGRWYMVRDFKGPADAMAGLFKAAGIDPEPPDLAESFGNVCQDLAVSAAPGRWYCVMRFEPDSE